MKSLLPVILITILLSVMNSPLFSQEDIAIFSFNKAGNIIPNKQFISPSANNCTSLQFSKANIATYYFQILCRKCSTPDSQTGKL